MKQTLLYEILYIKDKMYFYKSLIISLIFNLGHFFPGRHKSHNYVCFFHRKGGLPCANKIPL